MRKVKPAVGNPSTWPGPPLDASPAASSLVQDASAPAVQASASSSAKCDGDGHGVLSTFFKGTLSVLDNGRSNTIEVSSNAAGELLVNGGAKPIVGGTPTLANTNLIQVLGQGGNDTITLDETNGVLPKANLFGGAGNDTITAGSGDDHLFGQAGNDVLNGRGGADSLFGGAGDDVLTGGDGNDRMLGEAGNDRMIWNPGDDDDVMEGGSGIDTAEINGGGAGETFTIAANGSRVQFDRTNPLPFSVDIGTTEKLELNAGGGDDVVTATGNLAALINLKIDGGAGNDNIQSGNGNDTLLGGEGDDFIDGNQGADVAFMGAGNDVFQWDPGDGSDTVEGQDGIDKLLFNGSGGAEIFDLSANGERSRFFRNLGNIVMDNNEVEQIELNALGGEDVFTINDVTGTDVTEVIADLAAVIDGTVGDGVKDSVTAHATHNEDAIEVLGVAGNVSITGLPALVRIEHADALDELVVKGEGGKDVITASTLTADALKLTLDGGAGDDRILGGRGDDTLIGGDGDDFIDGQQGNDTAFMGAGDDVFQWDPGEGSDVVEGGEGFDTMLFNGAGAAETVNISANGERAVFFRDPGAITMDNNDVERLEFNALGGADNVTVNDLTGTDVSEVAIDLALADGSGDAQVDSITANATAGDDSVAVIGEGPDVQVLGLAAQIIVSGAEGSDRLIVNGLDGDDVIDATGLAAGSMALTLDGGAGDDVLVGSAGNDELLGGDGDDIILGNGGLDTADGGAGDDLFIAGLGDSLDIRGFADGDRLDLLAFDTTFDALLAGSIELNGDTILDLGEDQVTLRGVSISSLTQADILV
jgi:Ca2+-binding RTX toxin-like protein